ncbi:hypothetical protein E1140_00045, partial [Fulvivirga lutimaris]|nr:hypothetical protein [Fulvivirga lutimaris]
MFSLTLLAQENSVTNYFIKNFDYKQTGLPFANWQIIQSNSGIIYVANSEGLLTYDGIQWKNHLSTACLTIYESRNGIIYLGKSGDFGFLSSDLN